MNLITYHYSQNKADTLQFCGARVISQGFYLINICWFLTLVVHCFCFTSLQIDIAEENNGALSPCCFMSNFIKPLN